MADEDIEVALVLTDNLNDAIKRLQQFRAELNQTDKSIKSLREQMANFAANAGKSLELVARTMKEEFARIAKSGVIKPADIPKPDYSAIRAAAKAQAEAQATGSKTDIRGAGISAGRQAVAEAKAEYAALKRITKEAYDDILSLIRTYNKNVDAALKEETASKKAANAVNDAVINEKIQNEKKATDAEKAQQTARDQATSRFKNIVKEYNAINQQLPTVAEGQKKVNKEIKDSQKAAKAATGVFQTLGGVIKNAFSFFLGGSIFMFISRLVKGFQELVRTGEEYAQTIYRLGVSINQLQRRGMDITIKSEIALIKELSNEYKVFSQRGVVEAIASVQMLTRNFGFSQEQIRKTTELSMDLALVQGKDVAETAKQLALFYSSGYGEGLQHAGLAVNRMTVANEAQRMGLKKTYMQLTEVERAAAAYNLVTRQTTDLHKDAMKIQDSIIGQIKEQRSEIENVTNEIALKAIPVELAWLKLKLKAVDATYKWIRAEELRREYLEKEKLPFIPFIKMPGESEYVKEGLEKEHQEWEKILSETLDVSADINLDLSGGEEEVADKRAELGDKIMELYNDLEDTQEEYVKDSNDLEQDHLDKLEEITADGVKELQEIWEDYQSKLSDIQLDLTREIEDAWTDYYRELSDIDNDYRSSVQDANRKYHDEEIKAERDYQEKLRRLREEFLFDLEDALRQRDALQVLRLVRRYNLDKEQLNRQNEDEKQERADDFRSEMEELRREAAEKRREAWESLQQQIADANLAAERKREDAEADYQQSLVDLKEKLEEEKAEEMANYKERQTELETALEERKNKLLEAFGEEIGTTGTSLETLKSLFTAYFGAKGVIPAEIDNYIAKINSASEQTSANVASMLASLATLNAVNLSGQGANLTPTTLNPTPSLPWTGGHANGVQNQLLTSPQLFMAGEVPEVMSITPVSQLNSSSVGGNGSNGKGTVEINLSAGLEGRIIDSTLEQFDMILRKELEKR